MVNRKSLFPGIQAEARAIDWVPVHFEWRKAYVSAGMSSLAYEEIPEFELSSSERAKLIPSEDYLWNFEQSMIHGRRATLRDLQPDLEQLSEVIVRDHVLVVISNLQNVLFVALRGTTRCWADVAADLKVLTKTVTLDSGATATFHGGFYDALEECYAEIVTLLGSLSQPICITGHSLGGAMAAILFARLLARFNGPPRPITCYTFGMPRYLCKGSSPSLAIPHHVFNENDPVPILPPKLLGFVDYGNEFCINSQSMPFRPTNRGKGEGTSIADGFKKIANFREHYMRQYLDRTFNLRSDTA